MRKVESYDNVFSAEEKEQIIKDYVEDFLSLREIYKKYNIRSKIWVDKLLDGKKRSVSDGVKIAHKKYPNSFKLSEETKKKMREKRLAWMKANPDKTAWRLKNMSYPEKCFQEYERLLKEKDEKDESIELWNMAVEKVLGNAPKR